MRIHLFEFEDLSWFPDPLRRGMTDYLRYVLGPLLHYYKPVAPLLCEALKQTGDTRIIDLASGGGGAILQVSKDIRAAGMEVRITLTDRFPNIAAYELLQQDSGGKVDHIATPVDATAVPRNIPGFRVMFSAIHHLRPKQAGEVLSNAVAAGEGIAVFDGSKNIFTILGVILIHPLLFVVLTPFFRPFTFRRLVFTYLVPLIPLCTIWDGVVSMLRLYSPKDLLKMAEATDAKNYTWKAGKVKNDSGMYVTYLIGYPAKSVK